MAKRRVNWFILCFSFGKAVSVWEIFPLIRPQLFLELATVVQVNRGVNTKPGVQQLCPVRVWGHQTPPGVSACKCVFACVCVCFYFLKEWFDILGNSPSHRELDEKIGGGHPSVLEQHIISLFTQRLDYLALHCETLKVTILTVPEYTDKHTGSLDWPPKHNVCVALEQLSVGGAFCTQSILKYWWWGAIKPKVSEAVWDTHKHKPTLLFFSLLCHSGPLLTDHNRLICDVSPLAEITPIFYKCCR